MNTTTHSSTGAAAKKRATRSVLIACAAVAAFALGGCSAGAPAGDAGAEPGMESIVVLKPPVQFEPVLYAAQNGVFEKHGLDVTIKEAGSADAAITQVVSGDAAFAAASGVAGITAASKEIPVKIVVGNSNSKDSSDSGVLVAADGPISSIAQLEGKKVGINGLRNTTELMVAAGIDEAGGDSSKTEFVEIPYPAMADALKRGTVDAVYSVTPFYDASPESGFAAIENPATAEGGPLDGMASVAWVASDAYLGSNPETVKKFTAAMADAIAYLNEHPDEARDITAANSKLTREQIDAQDFVPFSTEIVTSAMTATIDAMKRYGFIETAPSIDQVLAPSAPRK